MFVTKEEAIFDTLVFELEAIFNQSKICAFEVGGVIQGHPVGMYNVIKRYMDEMNLNKP